MSICHDSKIENFTYPFRIISSGIFTQWTYLSFDSLKSFSGRQSIMRTLFLPSLMMWCKSLAETNPWLKTFIDSLTLGRGDFGLLLLPFCLVTAGSASTFTDRGFRKLSRSLNLKVKFYLIVAGVDGSQIIWSNGQERIIRNGNVNRICKQDFN